MTQPRTQPVRHSSPLSLEAQATHRAIQNPADRTRRGGDGDLAGCSGSRRGNYAARQLIGAGVPEDGGNSDTTDPFQTNVFHLLRLILQEHQSLWAARLAAAGLPECTKPQYALLRSALADPGLDQAAAGAFTGTDKSTVVSLVDRLERRGLLRRANDPGDRRKRRLFLTAAGEDFLAAVIPVVDQLSDELLARLSDTERETLVPILLKLAGEAGPDLA